MVARRRAVALAGHTGGVDAALTGLDDPAPEVRATALGALGRLGKLEWSRWAAAMADPSELVRRRACELATQLDLADEPTATSDQPAQSNVLSKLIATLYDSDPTVVEAACFALGEKGSWSAEAVGMLSKLSAEHIDPLVREAAVAALGAIGDPAGIPAILRATDDKPAVRRRAVLALAPFEGPDIDAALRKALRDRDWQVRQAAEDLGAEDLEAANLEAGNLEAGNLEAN